MEPLIKGAFLVKKIRIRFVVYRTHERQVIIHRHECFTRFPMDKREAKHLIIQISNPIAHHTPKHVDQNQQARPVRFPADRTDQPEHPLQARRMHPP